MPAEMRVCVQDNENKSADGGGGDTFSMMTSCSGINEVAQQLCVEPLIQLTATQAYLAFPKLQATQLVSNPPTVKSSIPHYADLSAFLGGRT